MGDGGGGRSFKFGYSYGDTRPLPADLLPPETIERLKAGGQLTDEEWATLRQAALSEQPEPMRLVEALTAAGLVPSTTVEEGSTAEPTVLDDGTILVEGPTQTRRWTWQPGAGHALPGLLRDEPPANGARRMLGIALTLIALAIPVGLVVLGAATGQAADTILVMGLFGAIIGVMLKKSLPGF